MGDGKVAWVQSWKQPTWQRRFLSFVFWEGVLITPLAVAYAYDTAAYWKLLAAALPAVNPPDLCHEALGTGTAISSPSGWPCRVVDLLNVCRPS
jgi:hypothetical protein